MNLNSTENKMNIAYLKLILIVIVANIVTTACSVKPEPIKFGTENCDHCRMTISDNRFGAEIVTKKGRVYKFDDLKCLKDYLKQGDVTKENIHSLWAVDFSKPETLTDVEKSYLLYHDAIRSPMGSNTAAFAIEDSAKTYFKKYSGEELKWADFISH